MIESYLISIGDSVNSILTWILVIISILLVVEFIIIIISSKIFEDYDEPDEEDHAQLKRAFKWAIYTIIILFFTLFVKALTPNTEQFIIMSGLNKIKTEQYDKSSFEVKYIKSKYPEIYGKIDFDKTKEAKKLKNEITKKLTIIDSLKNENDSLKQFILKLNN